MASTSSGVVAPSEALRPSSDALVPSALTISTLASVRDQSGTLRGTAALASLDRFETLLDVLPLSDQPAIFVDTASSTPSVTAALTHATLRNFVAAGLRVLDEYRVGRHDRIQTRLQSRTSLPIY